ncbi:Erythroid differentiation-related factor 1 [Spatholobus suberectus]|nr:Erythroid differentiation-related factor 1 [Spatholobus suberectus]
MAKLSSSSSSSSNSENSGELVCVGTLEIATPKPVGFLCGSIPVPTDKSFHHAFHSALLPTPQTVNAPRYRYRMLPTETDLNTPPFLANFPEKVLPVGAVHSKTTGGDFPWEGTAVASNFNRKCEALAVSGLVDYGDEIDVIAPADILKQIFKMPYSKARLSIAVHRIGHTLVLNTGPDVEEGEKLIRRHNNQSKCADQSLFLNFAMHSVRMEACDCPPTYHVPSEEQSNSSVLPGGKPPHIVVQNDDVVQAEGYNCHSEYSQVEQERFYWGSKKNRRNKNHSPVKKVSQVGEKPRSSMQESEKQRKVGNDSFLRILFWQFHNFRMLLGSDLLLFSNEKYVAVSLHLWDVTRQVTPLTWLEAWLDNVMASVPELAICYHHNGVVQGYELLKTDDIFLLKGISEDGTPAFHPYVVQQNGLSVLRFLQDNCKQDPGAYWLYKGAGEDDIQLFDLSVIPKNRSSDDSDDALRSLPSSISRGRSDAVYSLGTLLYRIAHRLSLSMAATNRARCVRFFRKCLEFLDDSDHLAVRAIAHEQFARLILNYDDELNLTSESLALECKLTVTEVAESSWDAENSNSERGAHEVFYLLADDDKSGEHGNMIERIESECPAKMVSEGHKPTSGELIAVSNTELSNQGGDVPSLYPDVSSSVCEVCPISTPVVQTVADPISSKLAAVHHVSQAIKSLRWMRQLQRTEPEVMDQFNENHDRPSSSFNVSVCACGDAECIEVCDIREWLPTSKLDHKLWKLVLLLGESYLALAEAYKEDGQLHQALKVIQLSCSVYGSMPPHLEDTKFISSMASGSSLHRKLINLNENTWRDDVKDETVNGYIERKSSTYLFWAKAWALVGDVYVEFHRIRDKEIPIQDLKKPATRDLRMSSEVVKEVKRLKKKLVQFNQNCSSCSLVNCSCQSDRASSGNSASSSSADASFMTNGRKHNRRLSAKNAHYLPPKDPGDEFIHDKENRKDFDSKYVKHSNYGGDLNLTDTLESMIEVESLAATNSRTLEGSSKMDASCSNVVFQTENNSKETGKVKNGGIFEYLVEPLVGDVESNLLAALKCYEEARQALLKLPTTLSELQSVVKKKGWVCNELGRIRLENKELSKAELAFTDAIDAFREVSDHTNIILINCNLGHGRRALAEEMVSKLENLKLHNIFHNAYNQALETAKLKYIESLRYYGAARLELNAINEHDDSVTSSLRNEAHTQFAHTYLRLGMLLARENSTAVYENGSLEDTRVSHTKHHDRKARKDLRKHEISANEAIREALSVYESLGELRKQEAAYAYFQLACYQRDCCLKFMNSGNKKSILPKGENSAVQRVKQYASLAERNWQKALDFYGPKTHPNMYLTILMERSALSLSLSSHLHSNMVLESALAHMLEGRHVSDTNADTFSTSYPELHAKYWSHLQMLLKKMLATILSSGANKSPCQPSSTSSRFGDGRKIRELYKMSLKGTDMVQLRNMYNLWIS